MKMRLVAIGLPVVLLFAAISSACQASSRRQTAVVRAIQGAKTAVVNIHSEKTAREADSLFSSAKGRKVNGMGTGIVVDERGYIVTNYHVVADVDSLRVTLVDGSNYNARVVSYDRQQDLAIIKIEVSRSLTSMPLGTSSDLMLGETVLAIGNAFGYEHTVTSGIVSSLSRDVEVNEHQSYKNLIQTDASINPGNSGGPLLNLDGEVVGINVAIRAGAQRIGFAIPIDDARRIIAQLLSVEQLSGTYHGLQATDVKSGEKRLLLASAPLPGSPAASADIRSGDIIVKAGTVDVVDTADFERAMLGHSAGEKVDIVVRRDSETKTLTMELAALRNGHPGLVKSAVRSNDRTAERAWQTLGLRLTQVAREQLGSASTNYRGGMRVTDVRTHSSAERNGIRKDDILVGLHEWETTKSEDLLYVLNHRNLRSVGPLRFYIVRGDETLYGDLDLKLASK